MARDSDTVRRRSTPFPDQIKNEHADADDGRATRPIVSIYLTENLRLEKRRPRSIAVRQTSEFLSDLHPDLRLQISILVSATMLIVGMAVARATEFKHVSAITVPG